MRILIFILLCSLSAQAQVKGDYITLSGINTIAGSIEITTNAPTFKSASVGKTVIVYGAGPLGDELVTKVIQYVNSTKVKIETAAACSMLNADGGIGCDNAGYFQSICAANKTLTLSYGCYLFTSTVVLNHVDNLSIEGKNGACVVLISSSPNSYAPSIEPVRDWIRATNCDGITIKGLRFKNVGQTQARPGGENGYYEQLNGVAVAYNRRYNSRANTGSAIALYDCQNTEIERVQTDKVGCLVKTSGLACSGLAVSNCRVKGYALTGVFPCNNSVISGNAFDNTEAPPIGGDDLNMKGTSHAIYITTGFSNILIENNTITACREFAFQINSGQTTAQTIQLTGNVFSDCFGSAFLTGASENMRVIVSANIFNRCGGFAIDAPGANIDLTNCTFSGMYQPNVGYNSGVTVIRCTSINAVGCSFSGFNRFFSSGAFTVLPVSQTAGNINITACEFFNCSNAVNTMLGHQYFAGQCNVLACVFTNARIAFGYQDGSGTSPAGSCKKFVFTSCVFKGNETAFCKYGVALIQPTFIGDPTIQQALLPGADSVKIINQTIL